jgi:hypothetical protein
MIVMGGGAGTVFATTVYLPGRHLGRTPAGLVRTVRAHLGAVGGRIVADQLHLHSHSVFEG